MADEEIKDQTLNQNKQTPVLGAEAKARDLLMKSDGSKDYVASNSSATDQNQVNKQDLNGGQDNAQLTGWENKQSLIRVEQDYKLIQLTPTRLMSDGHGPKNKTKEQDSVRMPSPIKKNNDDIVNEVGINNSLVLDQSMKMSLNQKSDEYSPSR